MNNDGGCPYVNGEQFSTVDIVDHIFESIAALRASVRRGKEATADDIILAETVVQTLTADVSKLFRNTTCASYPPVFCTAHGELEVMQAGSERHSEVLDKDFKVGGSLGIICRHCSRESVLYDVKFNFCSTCKYVRCMFCVPRKAIHWKTLRYLLEANPDSAGTLFPGSRLLLHELVALVPDAGQEGEEDALSVVRLVLSLYPIGARMPDNMGDLPLHWACCGRSLSCLKLILEAFPDGLMWPNGKGQIPLHIACRGENIHIVQLLLDSAPSPSGLDRISTSGHLPLHIAVSRQKIIPAIVLACLQKYPDAIRITNKKTKQTPLHLALSNRDHPDMEVVCALLKAYPASALLPIGQEAELPLHLVLSRPVPSIPVLRALLDVCPESALAPSNETAWSASETPLDLANRKAVVAAAALADNKDPALYKFKWEQMAAFRHAVRIMLMSNRKQDPSLLRSLNWEERKEAIFMMSCDMNWNPKNVLFALMEMAGTAGTDIARRVVSFL